MILNRIFLMMGMLCAMSICGIDPQDVVAKLRGQLNQSDDVEYAAKVIRYVEYCVKTTDEDVFNAHGTDNDTDKEIVMRKVKALLMASLENGSEETRRTMKLNIETALMVADGLESEFLESLCAKDVLTDEERERVQYLWKAHSIDREFRRKQMDKHLGHVVKEIKEWSGSRECWAELLGCGIGAAFIVALDAGLSYISQYPATFEASTTLGLFSGIALWSIGCIWKGSYANKQVRRKLAEGCDIGVKSEHDDLYQYYAQLKFGMTEAEELDVPFQHLDEIYAQGKISSEQYQNILLKMEEQGYKRSV